MAVVALIFILAGIFVYFTFSPGIGFLLAIVGVLISAIAVVRSL